MSKLLKSLAIPVVVTALIVAAAGIAMPGSIGRYYSYKTTGAIETRFGQLLYLNAEDSTITPFLIAGRWEPVETKLALSLVQPGDAVVDVGANVGYYTTLLASVVGHDGKVYAFEPEPTNFGLLEKSVEANDFRNVAAEQVALSDRPGTLKLYLAAENKGDHRIAPARETRAGIDIQAVRLDDYLQPETVVHFIKVDTQGAEGLILAGMQRVLEENEDIALVLEFWPQGLARTGGSAEQVLENLAELGFGPLYEVHEDDRGVTATTASELLANYQIKPDNAGPDDELHTNIATAKGAMKRRLEAAASNLAAPKSN